MPCTGFFRYCTMKGLQGFGLIVTRLLRAERANRKPGGEIDVRSRKDREIWAQKEALFPPALPFSRVNRNKLSLQICSQCGTCPAPRYSQACCCRFNTTHKRKRINFGCTWEFFPEVFTVLIQSRTRNSMLSRTKFVPCCLNAPSEFTPRFMCPEAVGAGEGETEKRGRRVPSRPE